MSCLLRLCGGTNAGTDAAATVMAAMIDSAMGAARRARPRRPASRKRISEPTSRTARSVSPLGRASVEESTVGTRTVLPAQLDGADLRDRRAAAQHERVLAGLDSQLAQMGGDEHGGTTGARVGDHVHGR